MSAADVARHSTAIATRVMPLLENVTRVAGYISLGAEVCVTAVLTACRERGQLTFVPIVRPGNQMVFAPITNSSELINNRYGIPEPDVRDDNFLQGADLDVVLVPLVGFDARLNRMGMGGGFYDRAFAQRREALSIAQTPRLIGVAHAMQQVDDVFADWWDVPLDYVVTEDDVISR